MKSKKIPQKSKIILNFMNSQPDITELNISRIASSDLYPVHMYSNNISHGYYAYVFSMLLLYAIAFPYVYNLSVLYIVLC